MAAATVVALAAEMDGIPDGTVVVVVWIQLVLVVVVAIAWVRNSLRFAQRRCLRPFR